MSCNDCKGCDKGCNNTNRLMIDVRVVLDDESGFYRATLYTNDEEPLISAQSRDLNMAVVHVLEVFADDIRAAVRVMSNNL